MITNIYPCVRGVAKSFPGSYFHVWDLQGKILILAGYLMGNIKVIDNLFGNDKPHLPKGTFDGIQEKCIGHDGYRLSL